jgi:hypothetical protein
MRFGRLRIDRERPVKRRLRLRQASRRAEDVAHPQMAFDHVGHEVDAAAAGRLGFGQAVLHEARLSEREMRLREIRQSRNGFRKRVRRVVQAFLRLIRAAEHELSHRGIGSKRQRLIQRRLSFFDPAGVQCNESKIHQNLGGIGLQRECLPKHLLRFRQTAQQA